MTDTITKKDIKEEQEQAENLPKKIVSFQDLLDEEQRLTMEFKRNKARVIEDFNIVKAKLQPANQALNFMNKLSGGTGKPGLVSQGVDIALDLVTKKYLFKRSSWFVTLAGSYLLRGLSHLVIQKGSKKKSDKKANSNGLDYQGVEEMENQ